VEIDFFRSGHFSPPLLLDTVGYFFYDGREDMKVKVELAEIEVEVDQSVIRDLPDDPIRYRLDNKEHHKAVDFSPRFKLIRTMGEDVKGCCFNYALGGDPMIVERNERILFEKPDFKMAPHAIVYYLKHDGVGSDDENGDTTLTAFHAGVVQADQQVISRFGGGHVYKHGLEVVPHNYGDKVMFVSRQR